MGVEGSATGRYHRSTYGDRPYEDFGHDFEAGLDQWDPDGWAAAFAEAGARYVVLVTKHHDGYCLWPSTVRNPNRTDWFSRRDLVGELSEAVRATGLRFGVYYSGGLDWTFDDRTIETFADLLAAVPTTAAYRAYVPAQVRELIDRYRPAVLWNDIAWPSGLKALRPLFDHHATVVPDGVVNDRWMPFNAAMGVARLPGVQGLVNRLATRTMSEHGIVPPRPPIYDYRTPEYARFDHIGREPWEACRGMDQGFGFNRFSTDEDHISRSELVENLADVVSKGGNLLLNVGPRGEDATIPPLQLRRLSWLGDWLGGVDGNPGIHGTRPWARPEAETADGRAVRFTARGSTVWATVLDPPGEGGEVVVPLVRATPSTSVTLADGSPVVWSAPGDGAAGISVTLPAAAGAAALTVGFHHVTA